MESESKPTDPSTFCVTTYGCQMNVHDSERIRGMLVDIGLRETDDFGSAQVLVFNTCTIREKPDQKMFNKLQHVGSLKARYPDRIIAIGGCLVEAQRERLFSMFPFVDVAFGPGHIEQLGTHVASRLGGGIAAGSTPHDNVGFFGIGDERKFAADLPQHRIRAHQAWVQISMGCNMTCAYCIVPSVRGKEKSRPFRLVHDEVSMLALDGVKEVTLLGQNVNSYGRDLPVDERKTFAELLYELDAIPGIERIRYTSPHPKDMRDDVIRAMAECPSVCEQLHLPMQSGSTRILKAMRRTYSRERFLSLVEKIRASVPDISFSTDIIVGFPGETEEDFQETLSLVEEVQFDGAFTFIFSPRSGTDAAEMPDLQHEVKQERLQRLVDVVRPISQQRLNRHVGTIQEVLVEGASRKDVDRMRGRTRHNVNTFFDVPEGMSVQPGDLIDVCISEATSESLQGDVVTHVHA